MKLIPKGQDGLVSKTDNTYVTKPIIIKPIRHKK